MLQSKIELFQIITYLVNKKADVSTLLYTVC